MTLKETLIQAFDDAGFDIKVGLKGRGYSEDVLFVKSDDGRAAVAIEFDANGNVVDASAFGIPGF